MVKLKSTLMVLFIFISGAVFGQTYEDVVAKFNEGADDINKGDYSTAISHLEEVLAMAETVGGEATDLASKSKEQIPLLNYQLAIGFIKQKDYENAIPYLEKTVDLSTEYGNNEEYKAKAMRYLPQLLTGVGTQKLKDENYDLAMDMFDKAIKYSPNYAKAYLGKGFTHKAEYEEEEMIENLTRAIELAKAKNDTKTVSDAQEGLGSYFAEMGNMELEDMDPAAEDYGFAVENYEKALEFQPGNADANYKLAMINNRMGEYDTAIEFANTALENETNEVKIAAIYYELGLAYYGNVKPDEACEAFKKANVGVFEEKATKKLNDLGC